MINDSHSTTPAAVWGGGFQKSFNDSFTGCEFPSHAILKLEHPVLYDVVLSLKSSKTTYYQHKLPTVPLSILLVCVLLCYTKPVLEDSSGPLLETKITFANNYMVHYMETGYCITGDY